MDFLNVGIIQNTHGLKGELKIKNLSDFNRFTKGSILYISHDSTNIKVEVLRARETQNYYLVVFKGLEDINLVEKYKGDKILISKDDIGELEDGRYYYFELIGKPVYNQDGVLRGTTTSVIEYPQSDMLEIDMNGKKKLIPFIPEFIEDVLEDRIIIKEIEGLL